MRCDEINFRALASIISYSIVVYTFYIGIFKKKSNLFEQVLRYVLYTGSINH